MRGVPVLHLHAVCVQSSTPFDNEMLCGKKQKPNSCITPPLSLIGIIMAKYLAPDHIRRNFSTLQLPSP